MAAIVRAHRLLAEKHAAVGEDVLNGFRIENAPTSKYVQACEHFDRAARCFAVAEMWHLSAKYSKKCADVLSRVKGAEFEAACYVVRAAELREASDPAEARALYGRAVMICCDLGRWEIAARLRLRACELEDHASDATGSAARVRSLRSAADLFGAAAARAHDERKKVRARECVLRAARDDALLLNNYATAAEVLEACGNEVLLDNLTAGGATRLFFQAALCTLCQGEHALLRGNLELFSQRHLPFACSAERAFLLDVDCSVCARPLPAYDQFVDDCYNLCAVRELDVLELTLLQRLQRAMLAQIEARDEDLRRDAEKREKRKQRDADAADRRARLKREADEAKKKRVLW